jgi:hypothetical protein
MLGSDFPSPMGTRRPKDDLAQLARHDGAAYRAVLDESARAFFQREE